MYIVVGLGNPGSEYVNTRHNIGFKVVDALAVTLSQKFSFQKKINAEVANLETSQDEELYLLKPLTYMNKSGESVRGLYDYFGGGKPTPESLKKLFVVFDDLDIPIGKYKIQLAKGPKVHNGLTSINSHLGSNAFYHVRVGIENRGELRSSYPGDRYVLSKFNSQELDTLQGVIPQIVQELIRTIQVR